MTAIARIVTRKGSSHAHRCEDESFSFTYGNITVLMVFDGCSSGVKSYFASGLFAKLFKKIAIHHADYFTKHDDVYDISKFLLRTFFAELKSAMSYLELGVAEVQSTIVYSVINTDTKHSNSVMIGDGTVYIDGKIETEQPEGNAPRYICYFLDLDFEQLWSQEVFEYYHKVEKTISVMTDGIDSFKEKNQFISQEQKDQIIHSLLEDEKFFTTGNEIPLQRKCNILENAGLIPSDDLAIARLVFLETEEPKVDEII